MIITHQPDSPRVRSLQDRLGLSALEYRPSVSVVLGLEGQILGLGLERPWLILQGTSQPHKL